jgi:S1-C subfamily serine protease
LRPHRGSPYNDASRPTGQSLGRPHRLLALAAAAAALVASGCGKDGSSTTSSAAAEDGTRTVQRTTRVEVLKPATTKGFDPEAIYERGSPGVVTVTATGLSGPGNGSLGSGFVISEDGEIATNAHVVTSGRGSGIDKAGSVYVKFADGNQVGARIVGFDPFADVALLKIDPDGLTLRPLPLGSIKDAKVGAPVVAIGSPFGEEQSLSVGVISGVGRPIQSLTAFDTAGAIQTDAAINRGNSGGPLIAADGAVLGINAQIESSSGSGSGVGFAIPVDTVKRSLRQIRKDGEVRYALLGISTTTVYPQLAERFDLPVEHGAWVQDVSRGGPSGKAGVRGGRKRERFQSRPFETGGDIIVRLGGMAIRQDTDVAQALLRFAPGQRVSLEIYRGDRKRTIEVTAGERPLSTRPRG